MIFATVMILSFSALIFSIMIILNHGDALIKLENSKSIINPNMTGINQSRIDVMLNPNFIYFNDTSNLPSYWSDPKDNCKDLFSCTIKFTDGWNDYVSFSLSTKNNTKNTWSSIYGQQIDVKSKGHYQLVTHMKLNNQSTQSHVKLEGFNETTKAWYQIKQCPSGKNGPLEWQEFSCLITIPQNTTKIRPVLNAGWSAQAGKEATTWFDGINLLTNVP